MQFVPPDKSIQLQLEFIVINLLQTFQQIGIKILFVLVINNRILVQWGKKTITNNTTVLVTLPITYSNATYIIEVTHNNGTTPSSVVSLSVGYQYSTYFQIANNEGENPSVYWLTIGY